MLERHAKVSNQSSTFACENIDILYLYHKYILLLSATTSLLSID